mmetsp:Transcript_33419/g.74858  ORF Transcript_33419/g.74858 Transcript_33419/m.74858 type:complete len:208 (+) Transcript_33419:186-809(+)
MRALSKTAVIARPSLPLRRRPRRRVVTAVPAVGRWMRSGEIAAADADQARKCETCSAIALLSRMGVPWDAQSQRRPDVSRGIPPTQTPALGSATCVLRFQQLASRSCTPQFLTRCSCARALVSATGTPGRGQLAMPHAGAASGHDRCGAPRETQRSVRRVTSHPRRKLAKISMDAGGWLGPGLTAALVAVLGRGHAMSGVKRGGTMG